MKHKTKKLLCSVLAFCQLFAMTAFARPDWPSDTGIQAEAGALMDVDSGTMIFGQNSHVEYPPASITKLLTALIVLEHAELSDTVTYSETAMNSVEADSGNKYSLAIGDTMTVEDCLYALLLSSVNQSANALAEHVAGSIPAFVDMMNQKARQLGCTHTHFVNASGLPDENHYSCAEDLAKIMRAGLKNARFRKVLETVNYTIPATNLSAARPMHTHVPLLAKESSLYYEGCIGGKTGFSTEAQNCLATVAERNGRTYIVVTMRDADLGINCADSTVLFDYAFNSFDSIEVDGKAMTVPKGVTVADLTMKSKEKGTRTLNQYYYQGQFVGYVTVEDTPTPKPVQEAKETTVPESSETESTSTTVQTDETDTNDTAVSEQKSVQDQISEMHTEGLSSTVKMLLIIGGAMIIVLIGLLIALHFKNS